MNFKIEHMKKASRTRMIRDVQFLTGIHPPRNHENLRSLMKVVDHITSEIRLAGLEPMYQTWTAGGNEYRNVLCSYQPEKTKRLIIGAHYDVCADTPGADDNASAVAGLLETIRIVMAEQPVLDYGIDFVAYCLEEPPYFGTKQMGSYIHASSVAHNRENIIGMICYEMIGYFSDVPGSQKFPDARLAKLYPTTGNFIMAVGAERYKAFNDMVFNGMRMNAGIDVQKISFPEGYGLAEMSDQRNYYRFDIPAMMINDTSFYRNPHYHMLTDTLETLDPHRMAEVVNSLIMALKVMRP
jgi:hypothetical protein